MALREDDCGLLEVVGRDDGAREGGLLAFSLVGTGGGGARVGAGGGGGAERREDFGRVGESGDEDDCVVLPVLVGEAEMPARANLSSIALRRASSASSSRLCRLTWSCLGEWSAGVDRFKRLSVWHTFLQRFPSGQEYRRQD